MYLDQAQRLLVTVMGRGLALLTSCKKQCVFVGNSTLLVIVPAEIVVESKFVRGLETFLDASIDILYEEAPEKESKERKSRPP